MKKKTSIKVLAVLNAIFFVATVVVNYLAVMLPINKTTGELSDQYPNLFTPAGITFSIWSVIYLSLAIFVIYSLKYAFTKSPRKSQFIKDIGLWFMISCLANINWIFMWHYENIPGSFCIMIMLLSSLIIIFKKLKMDQEKSKSRKNLFIHFPFSIYLAWISVATLANFTILLVAYNVFPAPAYELIWTITAIVIAILIGLGMVIRAKSLFFGLVINWALLGILIKRLSAEVDPMVFNILTVLVVGIVLISVASVIQMYRIKFYRH